MPDQISYRPRYRPLNTRRFPTDDLTSAILARFRCASGAIARIAIDTPRHVAAECVQLAPEVSALLVPVRGGLRGVVVGETEHFAALRERWSSDPRPWNVVNIRGWLEYRESGDSYRFFRTLAYALVDAFTLHDTSAAVASSGILADAWKDFVTLHGPHAAELLHDALVAAPPRPHVPILRSARDVGSFQPCTRTVRARRIL